MINITEEGVSQEFKLEKIREINNYFIEEIDKNELLSNKSKKVYTALNYIEYFVTLVFSVTLDFSVFSVMYFHFCFCSFNWCF